ncbi:MAG: hypothetical protein AAF663_10030, partial [Planctomycetota bacterium]
MLSLHRIRRYFDEAHYARLWAELTQSGLVWPLPLRIRLENSPTAVWALALRRVCELTHGSSAMTEELTDRLLHAQTPQGAWCDAEGREDPMLTALAAAALHRRRLQPGIPPQQADHLSHQHAAALAALAAIQDPCDGLFGDSAGGDGRKSASLRVAEGCYVLFLLAEDPAALNTLRLLPLRDALDEAAPGFDATLRETYDMATLLLECQ